MKVMRIKPLYTPKDSGKETKEVYYPVWIYVYSYHVKRKVFGDIKGLFVVLVDTINGHAYLADAFPQLEEVEAEDNVVLEPVVDEKRSDEISKDKAEAYLFRKYAYLTFSYRLEHKAFTYKLFWVMRREGGYLLTDSITGDEIEVLPYEEVEGVTDMDN